MSRCARRASSWSRTWRRRPAWCCRTPGLIEDLRASRQRLVAAQDEDAAAAGTQHPRRGPAGPGGPGHQAPARRDRGGRRPGGGQGDASASCRPTPRARWRTCATWPGASTRRCWPTWGWSRRSTRRPASRRCRWRSRPTGSGASAQDTEAAVYFCCLEALQNIAKYAHATQARICLQAQNGTLRFIVSDDGTGYDARHTALGSGQRNMADRLAALGGRLEVKSAPGRGTTITAQLPSAPANVPSADLPAPDPARADSPPLPQTSKRPNG